MFGYRKFAFAACIAVVGSLAVVSAARAQSFAGICAGTAQESGIQCQALKAADEEVKKTVGNVPTPGYTMGPEVSIAALCNGMTPAGAPGAKVPPECAAWKDAVETRAKAAAAVEASTRADAAGIKTVSSTVPVIRVDSGEQIAMVGKPMRIEGLVGNDLTAPRLKINGRPATLFEPRAGTEPVARNSYAFRIDVPTKEPGTQVFVLEACDAAGACVGKDMVVRVVASDGPSVKGRNYALVIGNNEYKTLPSLKTAVADATAVADTLKARYTFDEGAVKLLLNADRNAILAELVQLRTKLTPDDRLLIYYAGHGQIDEAANEGFWQPVDAVPNADYTWISNADLRRNLRGMSARHVLVVADSCFSGSLTRSAPQQTPNSDRFFAQVDGHFSRKVITSGGNEPVADSGTGAHSVFAHYFLKALNDNNAPYITSFELFNSLARAVANNSSQKPEYGTIGNAGDEGSGDFTFILKKG
jgi:uncharacterized caspase-like protein